MGCDGMTTTGTSTFKVCDWDGICAQRHEVEDAENEGIVVHKELGASRDKYLKNTLAVFICGATSNTTMLLHKMQAVLAWVE